MNLQARDADDPFAKNSDGTLTGDAVQVGKRLKLTSGLPLCKSNWEVSGRYTNIKLGIWISQVRILHKTNTL